MLARIASGLMISCAVAPAGWAEPQIDMNDFVVNCVSDAGQESVTLVRSSGSDKGLITTSDLQGEADIYPGLDSMTFLLLQDGTVLTLVVKYDSLDYDLMIKGDGQIFDRGKCSAS